MPYLNFNNDSIRCYTLKPKDLEVFKFEISELESIFNNNDLFKTFHCINCNAELDINNIVAINDHELYCKKCSNEIFVTCSCGRIEHKDNLKYVEDVGKSMCRNCFSNYRIRECNYCKKFFKNYNRVELIGVACNKCYDDHKCFNCCSCGRSFDQERYGRDNICITCANNKVENCLNYTFKPRPNFCKMPDEYNEYDLFYGIELEMGDAPSYNDVIKFISDNMGGLFYAKRDASIPAYGCEVVTHPATLKFHLERGNWDFLLKNAQKYNLRSDDLDKCGVHVHISRCALSNKECAMLDFFVNKKKDFWKKIARRESHYSAYIEKESSSWGRQVTDRHCAVNLSNQHTIEIRIFKGTLQPLFLKSYIEVCDALVYFIKQYKNDLKKFENNNNLENDFIKFFMNNEKYSNLKKYFENNCQ